MQTLPVLTNIFNFLNVDTYNGASFEEMKEFYTVVKECVMGSCYAIVIDEEIIYNCYDKTPKSAREILLLETIREQFVITPHLLIKPENNLNIKIYMFSTDPWYMHITYNNGFFKFTFYN
jgi:hypothetical protein